MQEPNLSNLNFNINNSDTDNSAQLNHLRSIIDAAQKDGDKDKFNTYGSYLSMFYVLEEVPGDFLSQFDNGADHKTFPGINYTGEELSLYLEDYFLREIDPVIEFLNRFAEKIDPLAVQLEIANLETTILKGIRQTTLVLDESKKPGKEEESVKEITPTEVRFNKLMELIEKIKFQKVTARENKYLDYLPDAINGFIENKNKVKFNINDTREYINDWLSGINSADEYVLQAMKENFDQFMLIFNGIKNPSHVERLIDLMLTRSKDIPNQHQLLILKLRQELFKFKNDVEKVAEILKDAFDQKILSSIFSDQNYSLLSVYDSVTLSPLAHIKSSALLLEIYSILDKNKNNFEKILFECALTPELSDHLSVYREVFAKLEKDLSDDKVAQKRVAVNQATSIKMDADIVSNYYSASISKSKPEEALADLAFKNPKLFVKLFKEELSMDFNLLKGREQLYRNLLNQLDIYSFFHITDCINAANGFFKALGVSSYSRANTKSYSKKQSLNEIDSTDEGQAFKFQSPTKFNAQPKTGLAAFVSGLFKPKETNDGVIKVENRDNIGESKKEKPKSKSTNSGFFSFKKNDKSDNVKSDDELEGAKELGESKFKDTDTTPSDGYGY